MVKHTTYGWAASVLLGLAACGPGLRDGSYVGDPRFTLSGTIENILVDTQQSSATLRVTVLWQMVAPPAPVTAANPEGPASATAPNTGVGDPTPSPPGSAPAAPTPPYQPTTNGQQGGAVNVAFPAPVSLVLYDTPQVIGDTAAWQAEGTVIIYYDANGDGRYDAGSESIAATLADHRLLYTASPAAKTAVYVDSILDNPNATGLQFSLAERRCDGLVEHLTGVANGPVQLTPGVPTTCPN